MRYLPLTNKDRAEMLHKIGVTSVAELYRDIPAGVRQETLLNLPAHQGELEVEQKLAQYANQNRSAGQGAFFLGAGCYHHHIPASVDYIIQRSEF